MFTVSLTNEELDARGGRCRQLNLITGKTTTSTSNSLKKGLIEGTRLQREVNRRLPKLCLAITYKCNLRCKGCSMVSPLTTRANWRDVTVQEVNRLFTRFNEVCPPNAEPDEVVLMGGEPFLHPNLTELVLTTKNHFARAQVSLVTNGTLINTLPQKIKSELINLGCGITVTNYEKGKSFTKNVLKKGQGSTNQCRTCLDHVIATDLNSGQTLYCERQLTPDGKLCYCGAVVAALIINKLQGHEVISVKEGIDGDFVNIFKVNNYKELVKFINKPSTPLSTWCPPRPEVVKWVQGTGELSEWVNV